MTNHAEFNAKWKTFQANYNALKAGVNGRHPREIAETMQNTFENMEKLYSKLYGKLSKENFNKVNANMKKAQKILYSRG